MTNIYSDIRITIHELNRPCSGLFGVYVGPFQVGLGALGECAALADELEEKPGAAARLVAMSGTDRDGAQRVTRYSSADLRVLRHHALNAQRGASEYAAALFDDIAWAYYIRRPGLTPRSRERTQHNAAIHYAHARLNYLHYAIALRTNREAPP